MPTFWQEPKTRWRTIVVTILCVVAYNVLRSKHINWAADLLVIVYLVSLFLSLRSFLPYGARRILGENDNE
jgi:hypothetical protein